MPPARVLSKNSRGEFLSLFEGFWKRSTCSDLSEAGVDPSIRHKRQPLNSVAQSCRGCEGVDASSQVRNRPR